MHKELQGLSLQGIFETPDTGSLLAINRQSQSERTLKRPPKCRSGLQPASALRPAIDGWANEASAQHTYPCQPDSGEGCVNPVKENSRCFGNESSKFPKQRNRTMKKLQLNYLPYQIYAGFAGMVVFWVYVQTLAPTVSFFDSGELIAAAYTLGVAHPPGYPLYVLLGWIFSKLPIGEGAYRLNLMSACFAALAALMVFLITHTILAVRPRTAASESSRNAPDPEQMFIPIISLVAALIFAFARTPWSQALIAEVYSLNAFLCGAIIWLLLRWRRAIVGQDGQSVSDPVQETEPLSVPGKHLTPGPSPKERGDSLPFGDRAVKFSPLSPPQAGEVDPFPPACGGNKRGAIAFPRENLTTFPFGEGRGGVNVFYEGKDIPRAWRLYLAAFLFGIGFGNHQTISLFFFAACFVVLLTRPRIFFNLKTVALILVWLAFGLSIHVLLPIRAAQNPPINWGNPSSWQQFTWLVTREGYNNVPRGGGLPAIWSDLRQKTVTEQDIRAGQSPVPDQQVHGFARAAHIFTSSLFFRQLATFHPQREFGAIGVILALLGLLYGIVRYRIPTLTLLIAIGAFVLLTIFVSDPPEENIFLVEEFHTPAYLLTAVLIGLGLMGLARWMLWIARPWKIVCYGLVLLLSLAFLLVPGSLMLRHVREVDRSRNYVAYDYASNVLMSLQPNAILFTWGDSGAFPLWYLQIVEQKRPDVILVHVPHLSSRWYLETLPAALPIASETTPEQQENILAMVDAIVQRYQGFRPIYFDFSSAHSLVVPYPLLPHGITYKFAMPGDRLDETVWNRYQFRGILDQTRIAMDPDIERTFLIYGSARIELGNYYVDRNDVEKAAAQFNAAVQFDPSLGEQIVQQLHFRNKLAEETPL